jgi:hypothetical protein
MGGGVRIDDEGRFRETREIVTRVHRRLGLSVTYTRRDFAADQRLIEDRSRTIRDLQQREAALVHTFESWIHGERR